MISFNTLNFKKTNTLPEFCNVWAQLYIDRERDVLLYFPAMEDKPINEELLLNYYLWKNGSVLSTNKHKAFRSKILLKLNDINELRNLKTSDFMAIKESFYDVSAIWLITLAHLINPTCFPVFDQHVYRAYKFMKHQTVDMPEYNKEKERINLYQEKYLPFFEELIATDTTIDRKKLDEALWGFGRFVGKNSLILDI